MKENEPGGERQACETWNPRKMTKGSSAKGTTEESDQRNIVIIYSSQFKKPLARDKFMSDARCKSAVNLLVFKDLQQSR
jgi:hypothetical protein